MPSKFPLKGDGMDPLGPRGGLGQGPTHEHRHRLSEHERGEAGTTASASHVRAAFGIGRHVTGLTPRGGGATLPTTRS